MERKYFDDKYITIGGFVYFKIEGKHRRPVAKRDYLKFRRMLKKIAQKGFPPEEIGLATAREWVTEEVRACFFCGARPRLWESDCDGPYLTAGCDSPQCNAY